MTPKLGAKVAVVTGGGGGIGRAVALALAAEGAKVIVADIGRDENNSYYADKVAAEIKQAGGQAAASYENVTAMSGGQKIVGTAMDKFGRIDILVNCAGNYFPAKSLDISESQWDSIISVHMKGHFSCVKAAIPEMMKQKFGRIVNISSRAATGGGGNLAYSAAKAGILAFTSALSMDLKEYGITANAIIPSADTKLFPGKRPKALGAGLPSPQTIEPDYVPPVIVYLSTDEAQSITGRFIYAAGGDLCVYARLLSYPAENNMFLRKNGKWTLDELSELLEPLKG